MMPTYSHGLKLSIYIIMTLVKFSVDELGALKNVCQISPVFPIAGNLQDYYMTFYIALLFFLIYKKSG